MAQQTIGIGTTPNDGTGDALRTAGGKINDNFTELYATQATAANIATIIHAATEKTTPVDADEVALIDSAASNVLKRLTWANIKATLKTYLDTLYKPISPAWSAMTVTASSGSGSITSYTASGYRLVDGKTTDFWATITITTIGTAGTDIRLTMPFTVPARATQVLCFRANDAKMMLARMASSSNIIAINGDGATFPFASGDVLYCSGRVETI